MKDKTKRWIIGGIGVALIGWSTGVIDPEALDVPVWWRLAATGGFLALVTGWIAAGKVHDLLPEDRGIFLIAFKADEESGAIYELNEDQFADLEVHGTLHEWSDSPERVYEVREYIPDENKAIGNWRETKPGSALARQATVDDALAAIRELRYDLEPDAAEARELKRRIRGIVRTLDRERAQAQQAALDDHLAPDIGDSRSISEVIESELPDDMHPETMTQDAAEPAAHPEHGDDEISFDVLEDGEALATDGGSHE